MKLDYSGICEKNLKSFIDLNDTDEKEKKQIISNVFLKKTSDMMGWLDLPDLGEEKLEQLEKFGKKIRKKYKNFIVLGIGGSALGVKMLKHAFYDSVCYEKGIKIYVCDNIDSYFVTLVNKLNLKQTMFNVVTKSGGTTETLAQMSHVINLLNEKKLKLKNHLCVTTTNGNDLYNFAVDNKIQTFDVPVSVGGRFSVLSNVGLVPASVMGLNLRDLLNGAKKIRENSKSMNKNNLAYSFAQIAFHYLKNGMKNLVFMPYSDRLSLVTDFFAQIWAESLGKKTNRNGKVVNSGQTPIKSLGATDQHSMLQLYTEGPNNKLFVFLKVENEIYDAKIKTDLPFVKHLNGTFFHDLLNVELSATAFSLTKGNRPNLSFAINKVNEKTMGEIIFLLEIATAFMGEMLNVNAFNQPGVEMGKKYARDFFNRKDESKETGEFKKFLNQNNFLILK